MTPRDLALRYMEIFFSGRDFKRLYETLADDMQFSGPLYQFDSAQAYIESLHSNPPVGCTYELLHIFEKGSWVNLIYEFSKPNVRTKMSQLFEIRNQKISQILLIFDTRAFL